MSIFIENFKIFGICGNSLPVWTSRYESLGNINYDTSSRLVETRLKCHTAHGNDFEMLN